MLERKLKLIGRTPDDIAKEFNILLMRLNRKDLAPEEKKHIAGDINGFINWLNSEKEKLQ